MSSTALTWTAEYPAGSQPTLSCEKLYRAKGSKLKEHLWKDKSFRAGGNGSAEGTSYNYADRHQRLLMYGGRTQVPTVVPVRLFLLVEATGTDAGLRYSITLKLALNYSSGKARVPRLARDKNSGAIP
ncbi:hypothetical protein LEMLEM_LOCUS16352 [Lemmus lemmus]